MPPMPVVVVPVLLVPPEPPCALLVLVPEEEPVAAVVDGTVSVVAPQATVSDSSNQHRWAFMTSIVRRRLAD